MGGEKRNEYFLTHEILQEAQKKALKVTVEPSKGAFIVTDPKDFSVTITMTSKAMEADATAASITGNLDIVLISRSVILFLTCSRYGPNFIIPQTCNELTTPPLA